MERVDVKYKYVTGKRRWALARAQIMYHVSIPKKLKITIFDLAYLRALLR